MKKLALLFLVAMMACALVGSSTVWARGTFTPVSGAAHFVVTDEGTTWLDEDGITHTRDAIMEWDFLEGESDLVGTGWGIYNMNIDMATGDGDTQGFHYLDLSFGELDGSFAGHADCIITTFVLVGDYVAHGDGGFAGMHLRMAVTFLMGGDAVYEYDGILHDPHGGGGNKAASADSQTWSSVKALYR